TRPLTRHALPPPSPSAAGPVWHGRHARPPSSVRSSQALVHIATTSGLPPQTTRLYGGDCSRCPHWRLPQSSAPLYSLRCAKRGSEKSTAAHVLPPLSLRYTVE